MKSLLDQIGEIQEKQQQLETQYTEISTNQKLIQEKLNSIDEVQAELLLQSVTNV